MEVKAEKSSGIYRDVALEANFSLEELVQERAGPGTLTPAPHHPIPLGTIWQCFGQPVQVPGLHGHPDH